MIRILEKVLLFLFAFSLGAGMAGDTKQVDPELQQKVQGHLDVIVDESAALVDDVLDEARKDERVQEAEEFVNDVREIAQNTADDIEAHFGEEESTEEEPEEAEVQADAKEAVEEAEETEVSVVE